MCPAVDLKAELRGDEVLVVGPMDQLLIICLQLHCCRNQRLRGGRVRPAGFTGTLRIPGSVYFCRCTGEGWANGAKVWVIVESIDLTMQGCCARH